MTSTGNCSPDVRQLAAWLRVADAVLIGAGAGLSVSAGFTYAGERFERHFADFIQEYGLTDMYSAGFYSFPTPEEQWGYWSRHIYWNRYDQPIGKPFEDLLALVQDKDYFVLTTNVDHRFQAAGFDKQRLFYTQGDYGLWQCAKPCHQKTYDNEAAVRQMMREQKDRRVPTALLPRCPRCGSPMSMNLRADATFVQDDGWHAAAQRYSEYVERKRGQPLLMLELGVGGNTPGIIKYPFWRYTHERPEARYACVALQDAYCPPQIAERCLCLDADIGEVLAQLRKSV